MFYINENVKNLNRIFDQNERKGNLKLDLNEDPIGFSQEFINEVLAQATPEFIAQYPETRAFQEKLAKFLGVKPEELCLTNGSAEAVRYIIEAFSSVGGKVLGVKPSYAMYEIFSLMYGREFIACPYEGRTVDVDKFISMITPDLDLLVVLNPNNPFGDVYSEEDMERIIKAAQENEVTVMIDEAYHYFYDKTFLHFAIEYPHVFVTRTFTKMFGLGSGRLGFAVGQADGIAMIQKLCTPHNVNAFGMLFAEAVIDKEGMLDEMIAKQKEGKKFVIEELQKRGYPVIYGEGNFIFVKPKTDAATVMKRMKEEQQILIKTYSGIADFGDCLRVSTGRKEAMEQFLAGLEAVDK